MAEAGFTKGPWSYAPAVPGAKRSFYIAGNNAAHNRQVDIGTVQGGYYSCEANARLIAAAPDLFEAAQKSLALLEKGAAGWGVAKDILRVAIAKAEGK